MGARQFLRKMLLLQTGLLAHLRVRVQHGRRQPRLPRSPPDQQRSPEAGGRVRAVRRRKPAVVRAVPAVPGFDSRESAQLLRRVTAQNESNYRSDFECGQKIPKR